MKFFTRSLLILFALYGLVFAIGDAYLARAGAPPWTALIFVVVFIGLQYFLSPLFIDWLMDISWDDTGSQLPARNRQFVEQLCAERGLKVPRIGIIYSGTPNAFSFGRTPRDANVVVTQGLLDVLTPEESNAVLAHEIGHIEHWDFLVMTFAALVPLLLYQIYVFTRGVKNFRIVAYSAYVCYLLSQYIVLLLNRTREYFADHYAAEVTHAPDDLSSALIKIAYGMVRSDGEYREALALKTGDKKQLRREHSIYGALGVMGISNLRSGAALALSGADPASAAAVMRWDLVNPWARVYEMSSTHPLTALRVRALNDEAASMHQAVRYSLAQDQGKQWGNFVLEVLLWSVPWICAVLFGLVGALEHRFPVYGAGIPDSTEPSLLIVGGVTWVLRVWYRYHGEYQDANIGSLIEDVEVSQMRTRAVHLKGKIVGRGVPGAFWSPDLVLRDSTGILFVLYQPSIPFFRFLFAISAADEYIDREVEINGWFRRGLRPYVEMAKLTSEDDKVHRTYSRWVQYAGALAAIAAGWAWLVGWSIW